jgi:RND family efflux transporter MFP subunit
MLAHTIATATQYSLRLRAFAPMIGSILIAAVLAGCQPQAAPAPPAPQVSVAKVIERKVNDWDEFTGRIQAVDSVEIRPRVSGYIEKVAFTEGGIVKKGDLLFVIDPRPYHAELARAKADAAAAKTRAELARNEVARAERLLAARAISQEEYDERVNRARETGSAVEGAAAAVEVARLNLEFTQVVSPIDGRVGKAEVTPGNLVGTGEHATLLTTVVSVDPVYVEFTGDEQVYLKYASMSKRGERASSRDEPNPVYMGLANEEGFPHAGYMNFVDNQLDPATGTIRGRATFRNPEGLFTPGLFARIKLLGSGQYEAVLISDRAVGTDQSQKFVLVVGTDKTLSYRPVKLGRIVQGLRVVLDGLQPGETIVVNGLQHARPGVPVSPQIVPMDKDVPASARLPEVGGTTQVSQNTESRKPL